MLHRRTQSQIMQSWKMEEPCLVSVVCITYNHEKYIREAIESFLAQETDFPFEIIIHDDASTDETPNIIKEYQSLYPDIIRPIFQKENQYSKGGFKPSIYAAGYSSSKYIALCEGDDYWINNQKLTIQIEAMLEHPEVDFSFHSAYCLCDGKRDINPSWDYHYDRLFYPDSILNCIGSFAPTASYLFRRKVIGELPDWFYDTAPVGDFFLEMYGAKRGGALYVDKAMSVYRTGAENSWSATFRLESPARLKHREKMVESLLLLINEFPEYSDSFNKKIAVSLGGISNYYLQAGNYDIFREYIEKSIEFYSYYSLKQQVAFKLRFTPKLLFWLFKISSILKE